MLKLLDFKENIADETATFGRRDIYERVLVLGYEAGMIMRSVVHARGVTNESERRALIADSLAELSDLATQVGMAYEDLYELAGPQTQAMYDTFETLVELGKERQRERMQEWQKRRAS